ncbi:GTP cyclohydrolase I [Candidatus Roizmanbacteria bacterium]|nr:GTP cyclohydrolase I [Candidatus Roizmanbacteria bacterium]
MKLAHIIEQLIINFGEDIKRDGVVETPAKVESMYIEHLSGYKYDPKQYLKNLKMKHIRV